MLTPDKDLRERVSAILFMHRDLSTGGACSTTVDNEPTCGHLNTLLALIHSEKTKFFEGLMEEIGDYETIEGRMFLEMEGRSIEINDAGVRKALRTKLFRKAKSLGIGKV